MKLAIIAGVSEYRSIPQLPGCNADLEVMKLLLSIEQGFQDVLVLSNLDSADFKERLTDFVAKYAKQDVEVISFYFTGHGEFVGGTFRYLLRDYDPKRKAQTSLENGELDTLLRGLGPSLTVKIVDACQSGVNYIKDVAPLDDYLKGTSGEYENCYFMFSSQADQASFQDNRLSQFTRELATAVHDHPRETVRYKDVMDHLSDAFSADAQQTPLFVVQARLTEQFCLVTTAMKSSLSKLLVGTKQQSAPSATQISIADRIAQAAEGYCSEPQAIEALERFVGMLEEVERPAWATDLFDVTVLPEARAIKLLPNYLTIAKWLDQYGESNGLFAQVQSHVVSDLTGFTESREVFGFSSTVDLPFSYVVLQAAPKLENLPRTDCVFLPILCKREVQFFHTNMTYKELGWDRQHPQPVDWEWTRLPLQDGEAHRTFAIRVVGHFWEQLLAELESRFSEDSDERPTNREN